MEESQETMILVRDAIKNYKTKKVLQSLSMSVKKKQIFGLLGPSSCGKTTLLSCILGLRRLDSGFINMNVRSSKEVGYMPQEHALYETFTLDEACNFYGMFFGLDKNTVAARKRQLAEFLSIEECLPRIINTCSGGQKRRISFLIAILHNPSLLILDEPTVGMDCLLSERIWNYLIDLSREGKTIILTTHYIQEAKNCNVIGFMRKGTLLEEKSPIELMNTYQTTNLEDIFLQVCKRQQNALDDIPTKQDLIRCKTTYKLLPDNLNFDKHRFMALVNKNFLWLKRNIRASIGLVMLPILIPLFFGWSVGTNPKDMKLGFYSEGTSFNYLNDSCNLQRQMYREHLNCTLPFEVMCWYMEELKGRDITLVQYNDYNQLAEDLAISKIFGSIEMNKNFTASIVERLASNLETPDTVTEKSILTIRLDPSNTIIKLILINHVAQSMEILYKKILTSCGLSDKLYVIPMEFKEPVYGFTRNKFEQSALPGFLAVFPFYFSLMYVASSLVEDKVMGLYDRNTASGMTYLEVVLAHLVIQICVMVLQNGIELILFFQVLGYEFMGSLIVGFVVVLVLNGLGISFGFVLSELFRSEILSCYACVGWFPVSVTTTGIIWPQEGVHFLLGAVLIFIPVTTMSDCVRSVVVRGYDLFHPFVFSGLITNIGWIIIATVVTYLMHKRNKNLGM